MRDTSLQAILDLDENTIKSMLSSLGNAITNEAEEDSLKKLKEFYKGIAQEAYKYKERVDKQLNFNRYKGNLVGIEDVLKREFPQFSWQFDKDKLSSLMSEQTVYTWKGECELIHIELTHFLYNQVWRGEVSFADYPIGENDNISLKDLAEVIKDIKDVLDRLSWAVGKLNNQPQIESQEEN